MTWKKKHNKNASTSNFEHAEPSKGIGMLSKKIGHLGKETEDKKKKQMEILELKNTITEIKSSVDHLTAQCRG